MGFVPNHLGHLIKYHLINIIWFTHFYGSFIEINHNLWSTIRDLVACRLYREGLCRPFYLGIVIFLTSMTLWKNAKLSLRKRMWTRMYRYLASLIWFESNDLSSRQELHFLAYCFIEKIFRLKSKQESNVKFKNKMVKADRENENLLWSVISQKVGV